MLNKKALFKKSIIFGSAISTITLTAALPFIIIQKSEKQTKERMNGMMKGIYSEMAIARTYHDNQSAPVGYGDSDPSVYVPSHISEPQGIYRVLTPIAGPLNSVAPLTLAPNDNVTAREIRNWFDTIDSSSSRGTGGVITIDKGSASVPATLTKSDIFSEGRIQTWIGNFPGNNSVISAADFTLKSNTITLGNDVKVAQNVISFNNPIDNANYSFTINYTWDQTRLEEAVDSYWSAHSTAWANTSTNRGATPPSSLTLTQIKSILGITSTGLISSNLFQLKTRVGAPVSGNTLLFSPTDKTVSFQIWYPENGTSSSTSYKMQSFSWTWTSTQNETAVANWWSAVPSTTSPNTLGITTTPNSIDRTTILSAVSGGKPSFVNATTGFVVRKKGGNNIAVGSSYTPVSNEKQIEFEVATYLNGVSGNLTSFKTVSYNYGMTQNETAASTWFGNISAKGTIAGAPPPGPISLNQLSTYLNNTGNKPTGLTANLEFVGPAPTTTITDHQLVITLKFPTDGVNGANGYLAQRKFTINFAKTRKQQTTTTWFNGLASSIRPRSGAVPTSISFSTIKGWIGASGTEASNLQLFQGNSTSGSPVTSLSMNSSSKSATFTVSLPSDYGPNPSRLSKTYTVSWGTTRDEDAVTVWMAGLSSSKSFSGYPETSISFSDVLGWLNPTPAKPTIGAGAPPTPIITTSSNGTSSFQTLNVNQNQKTFTFYVRYPVNGVSGSLTVAHSFTVTFAQTRQVFMDAINIAATSLDAKSDSNLPGAATYTANPAAFGAITSNVDTSGIPKTLAQLKAQTNAFVISTPGVSVAVKSIANTNNIGSMTSHQIVTLTLTMKGATRIVALKLNYKQADIAPNINATQIGTLWNSITVSGNTNSSIIHVPKNVIDYFHSKYLEVTMKINGGNNWTIKYDSSKPVGSTYDKVVPNGILSHNSSGNRLSLTMKLSVLHSDFVDPTHALNNVNTISKAASLTVWIDTSTFQMWREAGTAPSGQAEITGTTTENWGIATHIPGGSNYKLEFRWDDGTSQTPWVSQGAFQTRSWWNQFAKGGAGEYTGNPQMRIVANSGYVLSAARITTVPSTIRAKLTKVINVGASSGTNGTNAAAPNILLKIVQEVSSAVNAMIASSKDSENLNWANARAALTTFQTLTNTVITFSTTSALSGFTAALPTKFPYIHANRHLWVKITPASGFMLSGTTVYDLSDSSYVPSIKNIIGLVKGSLINITNKTISGLTSSPKINLSALPNGLRYQYSLDNGANWTRDVDTFTANMNNIHLTKAHFKFRIEAQSAQFRLDPAYNTPVQNFDVSGLKTFIDSSAQQAALASMAYVGQFGLNQQVMVESPTASLGEAALAQSRMKLQYKLSIGNHTSWTDAPVAITGDGSKGTSVGVKYWVLDTGVIPQGTTPVTIDWRLVPYLQDGPAPTAGTTPSRAVSIVAANDPNGLIAAYVAYTKAELSNNTGRKDTIILPTVVAAAAIPATNFTYGQVHTKDFTMAPKKTSDDLIAQASTGNKQSYWNNLKLGISIDDKNGSKRYAFEVTDFVRWLHGDFATAQLPEVWEVENGSGIAYPRQIDMKYVSLPSALKVPDWNNLDMSSIKARWVTTTTINKGSTQPYVSSDNTVVDISGDFISHVLKWWNATSALNAAKSVYIKGTTHSYIIDETNIVNNPLNSNTQEMTNAYLGPYGLKRQFSNDGGTTWVDSKPSFASSTWAAKVARSILFRIVPTSGFQANKPFIGNRMYVSMPSATTSVPLNTTYKVGNTQEREFKVYVDSTTTPLGNVAITGNQFRLAGATDANGVDESVDTNADDMSVMEIQYLYGGTWYNKAALVAAIVANRTPGPGQDPSSITFPTDFSNGNVQVRWHLTGAPNDYVMSSSLPTAPQYTHPTAATATGLLDFVNLWNIQSQLIKTSGTTQYGDPKQNSVDAQGELVTSDYLLTGSLNAATLVLRGQLSQAFLNSHGLKMQFSTKQYPTGAKNSVDWTDGTFTKINELFDRIAIDNQHKSLWVRFVSIDATKTNSSVFDDGRGTSIYAMMIDATKMKFSINFSNAALLGTDIDPTGDTQGNFDAALTGFFDGTHSAFAYETPDPTGNGLITVSGTTARKQYLIDNGVTIRWKVTQTRTGSSTINGHTINTGDVVEFDKLSELQAALASGQLNFNRSTLRVQWGILPSYRDRNVSGDATWYAPTATHLNDVVNIIYSRDTISITLNSITLGGNTRATTYAYPYAPIKATALSTLGLKLQYSLDQSKWTDTKPVGILGAKNLWIRLAGKDANYDLADSTQNQVTKINPSKVFTAISLGASQASWEALIGATGVTGKTAFGEFTINNKPTVGAADDSQTKGHWEYTIEQVISRTTKWSLSLQDAMDDYYGSGVKGFDLDREQHYTQRYVLNANEITLPGSLPGYQFTDVAGNIIPNTSMQSNVDITGLIQQLYIDSNVDAYKNAPSGMTWRQLADQPKFLPNFNTAASNTPRRADYINMAFQGNSLTSGRSFYGFDENPFKPGDFLTRSGDNALAPRHAHFEYSTKDTFASNWSAWTKTLPIDRPLETSFHSFRVRIVADSGFELPATVYGNKNQSWEKEYNVIIIRNTVGIASDTAQFTGWEGTDATGAPIAGKHPSGRFLTDDANSDWTKGAPIITMLKSGISWQDFRTVNSYVIEYNIKDSNGFEISWTDTAGNTSVGWHTSAMPPSVNKDWYGDMPTSLKNGDKVVIRLRAKNGYVIDDIASDHPDQVSKGFGAWSSTVQYTVTGLRREIVIPANLQIYDTAYHKDFHGGNITRDNTMPSVTFLGGEASGTISFNPGSIPTFSPFIGIEVQVLRVIDGAFGSFNDSMSPYGGYGILDNTGKLVQQGSNPMYVMNTDQSSATTTLHKYDWLDTIDDIPNTWVDPATVNYLQVSDAIRIRLVAKKGAGTVSYPDYGFMWEDPTTTFLDEITTPKLKSQFAWNTGGVMAEAANPETDSTPLPVTGLKVIPPVTPSQVLITIDQDPANQVNGKSVWHISPSPHPINDKWLLFFQIKRVGSSSFGGTAPDIPGDLSNGDQIRVTIGVKAGYAFDPSYIPGNTPYVFTVTGLKDKIDTTGMSHPILEIEGYEGVGTITGLIPNPANPGFAQSVDANGFHLPRTTAGGYQGKGVHWEYQVAQLPPIGMNSSQIALLPWTKTLPTNLKVGWYIRARVVPNDPKDIAYPFIYSYTTDSQYDSSVDGNVHDSHKGWIEVKNLLINPGNIDMSPNIGGFRKKTVIKADFHQGSFDEDAVIPEFKSPDSASTHGAWVGAGDLKGLDNSHHISVRLRARPGFIFDPADPNLLPGMTAKQELDSNGVKQWYLYFDDGSDKDWTDIEITGLKLYLDVESVSIDNPKPADGLQNYEPMPGQTDLVSGLTSLKPAVLSGLNQIGDLNGVKVDPITGQPFKDKVKLSYVIQRMDVDTGLLLPPVRSDKAPGNLANGDQITVELVSTDPDYKLSSVKSVTIQVSKLKIVLPDVDWPRFVFIGESGSGSVFVSNASPTGMKWEYTTYQKGQTAPNLTTVKWSAIPPTTLANGDYVSARLVNTVDGQQVNVKNTDMSAVLKSLKGLLPNDGAVIAVLAALNALPNFASVTNKVSYDAVIEGLARSHPKITQLTGEVAGLEAVTGGTIQWYDPNDAGRPVISAWTEVVGLKTIIDFSTLRIKVWNASNPYQPNGGTIKNSWRYAFRMEGVQDGGAHIKIDAPLYSTDLSKVLTDASGSQVPYADKLAWEFAVDDKNDTSLSTRWQRALPVALHSGQYVHARIVIKNGVDGYEVRNFTPITFQIPKLQEAEKIDTKTILLVVLTGGGSVLLGAVGGGIYYLRSRKKFNYKTKM